VKHPGGAFWANLRVQAGKRPISFPQDFVSVHVPLTKQTAGMFAADQFGMMRSAFVVNTSKGRVVNETDLIDALKKRTIAGTGLNVQATEPLLADSPLLELDNVIVTLHIASFTRGTDVLRSCSSRGCHQVCQRATDAFCGKPPSPDEVIERPSEHISIYHCFQNGQVNLGASCQIAVDHLQ